MKRIVMLLIFPLLAHAETVNHCYDQAKRKSVFTDQPCERLGLILRTQIDGSNMSRADGLPRVNYVNENGEVNNRPKGWYDNATTTTNGTSTTTSTTTRVVTTSSSRQEVECLEIKRNKELWENINSDQGRKNAAEYRYQYSKLNCHAVVR